MSLFILFISMSALVSGIKEGVNDVANASFLPVAAFVVTPVSYTHLLAHESVLALVSLLILE